MKAQLVLVLTLSTFVSLQNSEASQSAADTPRQLPGNLSAAFSEPMPLVLQNPDIGYADWVDHQLALNPAGQVDDNLFRDAERQMVAGYFQMPIKDGCHQVGTAFNDYVFPYSRTTIADAARDSVLVVEAIVTGTSCGFMEGVPGQLLRVAPENAFKGTTTSSTYFAFIPVGSFSLGSSRICKTDPSYAEVPKVGERVFLFSKIVNERPEPLIQILGAGDVIPVDANGHLNLPRLYARSNQQNAGSNPQDGSAIHSQAATSIVRTEADLVRTIQRALTPNDHRRPQ